MLIFVSRAVLLTQIEANTAQSEGRPVWGSGRGRWAQAALRGPSEDAAPLSWTLRWEQKTGQAEVGWA